ncbi:MAG: tetratricopeptide repeat protein [Candidatus Aminicenantes bacterium]|nr:tetratricopeptide repeat protein [Candidatus Aminicenantes bacterium]NIM84876.1 tetratricopeptide repeat protein [Candidatus Aminicenantes bacterium]NIN24384.1 tetratricopeptide repeat protein [Candidatus Aminicenantes bacterium]NIN48148.1 tetratricopeptide repeat protein [Candidatus Aminicenantes bacterium]NIN91051.1 tetratricopeptide repeat protein [Candidatus Aminicenantes bacterium]
MNKKTLYLVAVFIVTAVLVAEMTIEQKIAILEQELVKVSANVYAKIKVLNALATLYYYKDPKKLTKYAYEAMRLAQKVNNPKGEAEALAHLSWGCLQLGFLKEAEKYGNKSLAIFEQLGDKKDIARSLNTIGNVYFRLSNFDKALENHQKALKIREETGDKRSIAETLVNIGNVYASLGKHDKALEYNLKSMRLFEQTGDQYAISSCIYSIAILYHELKNHTRALEYYREALKIKEKIKDKPGIANSLNGIGLVYSNLKEYHKALEYYSKALKIREELGEQGSIASTVNNIGLVYFLLKDYPNALKYQDRALRIREMLGDKWNTAYSLINIGNVYARMQNYDTSLMYLKKSLRIAREMKANIIINEIYKGFSEVYAAKGDYETAYKYHKDFHQTDKALLNEKSRKQINELQARYETEKKEKEIEVLKKTNEIKTLKLSQGRITRNALIIGFILVLIILALLFRRYLYLFAFWKKHRYVGQFRLMEKIGSGGMGTVYKAYSIHNKSEIAAVKILKEELFTDPTSKKRFKREAAIIDKLEHPNIVKIFERGESKQSLFIAMEFLEGKTLEGKINEEGQLTLKESLHIMVQMIEALAFIHSKRIIHRDLKPGNVMLIERNGDANFVKLLDFGLAKIEFESHLTQSGNFLGTLQYVAPEQIIKADSSPANDIFSLGVTFYRMLCGQNPFPGETVIDVMRQIIGKDPASVSELRQEIPGELNTLVMQMIHKEPGQRPSASSIRHTLQHFI